MVRLIDADAIEHCLVIGGRRHGKTIISEIIRRAIQAAPTVDAVPVVRCKDCKWFSKGDNGFDAWECCTFTFGKYINVDENHFCSWAERKDE